MTRTFNVEVDDDMAFELEFIVKARMALILKKLDMEFWESEYIRLARFLRNLLMARGRNMYVKVIDFQGNE